jgi:predicted trehalose synthase
LNLKNPEVLPHTIEELQVMWPAYLLNQAMYELGFELNHRSAWLNIPLQGVIRLMGAEIPRAVADTPNPDLPAPWPQPG